MASIEQLRTKFAKTELSRPSRFQVEFAPPRGLTTYRNAIGDLSFKCEAAQLPSRTVMTTDQRIYGFVEKFPDGTSYEDISFTFIVSDNMSEKKLFDNWLSLVQPTDTYNLKFKADYQTDISVVQYDQAGKETYRVKLEKAYPIAINQLELDWGADGYHKLLVVFAYSRWVTNY